LLTWWHGRSAREQRFVRVAVAAATLVVAVRAGQAIAGDLAAARARIRAQEEDLAVVRRLAGELLRAERAAADAGATPLVTRIEAAASAVVARDRIASMTPLLGPAEGVAVRLVGTSLGEAVRILHGIESDGGQVTKLDVVKHPDDPGRFDVVLEVGEGPRR
jgi:hypothetical protein